MDKLFDYALKIREETEKIIIGKGDKIELILMSVLAGGHVLLNDLPGSGKTTLVKTMARALGCTFSRLQFTPDLLPSDILGMMIYNQREGAFELKKGPVYTNVLLADEINRAIPRTQSALLEAMEEGQVTIDGTCMKLPEPFLVLATQNPVEQESTFQLPAAQMDRFFIRLSLGYPTREEEQLMLKRLGDGIDFSCVRSVTDPERLIRLREEIKNVKVSDPIGEYLTDLVHRTRTHPLIRQGASPRSSRSLYLGGKTWAAMKGRDYVVPGDIQTIWDAVMNHRLVLTSDARLQKKTAEEVLQQILQETPVPPKGNEIFR